MTSPRTGQEAGPMTSTDSPSTLRLGGADPMTSPDSPVDRRPLADGRARRPRPVRPVRWALRPRDAGPGLCRAGGGLPHRLGRSRLPDRVRHPAAGLRRAPLGPDRLPEPVGGAGLPGPAQAGGPQPHRQPQDQQRPRQTLLARRMGKKRVVAETGAGQHGVATATAAAYFGLDCVVYMGEVDVARQALNVFRMELLGAEVRPALSGSRTLKDAVNEAMRDWVATVEDTYYCLGSVMGPHPYPWMVREFHRVIGRRGPEPSPGPCSTVTCPTWSWPVSAAVPTAAGIFARLRRHPGRAGRRRAGRRGRGQPGRPRRRARLDVVSDAGRVRSGPRGPVGVGRSRLPRGRSRARPPGRHRPSSLRAGDRHARCSTPSSSWPATEGIIPALESAHGLAWMARKRDELAGKTVLLSLSGRGDKDVDQVQAILRGDPEAMAHVDLERTPEEGT